MDLERSALQVSITIVIDWRFVMAAGSILLARLLVK